MYLLFKLFHIVSVVLFLGNITTGLFWHAHAARTQDPRLLAHTMDGIIRSDRWFTMPGVIGIILTGILVAMHAKLSILGTGWIAWTLILFGVSGLVFMFRVAPLQKTLRAQSQAGVATGTFDYAAYRTIAVRWEAWGAVALLTPVAGLVLMQSVTVLPCLFRTRCAMLGQR